MNYLTKFAIGEEVFITEGLYSGKFGVVKDYTNMVSRGFVESPDSMDYTSNGQYTVKLGRFKEIIVLPRSLARASLYDNHREVSIFTKVKNFIISKLTGRK